MDLSVNGSSVRLWWFLGPDGIQRVQMIPPSQGSGKQEMITPMVGWSALLKRIWLVSSFLLKMSRDCCCKGVQSGERGFGGIDRVIY